MKCCAYIFMLLLVSHSYALLDTSQALLSRRRRMLLYQPGLNWVQMVVGIGLPIEIKDHSITMGVAVKSYYELPNNSSVYTHPTIDIARRRRRSATRWDLYFALQHFAERFGYKDGKSCLLRAICNAAAVQFDEKIGLLSEIFHLILTPSSTNEDVDCLSDYDYHDAEVLGMKSRDCNSLFPCKVDFMSRFSQELLN